MGQRILFIDRDGTLISEPPENFQVDCIEKLVFEKNVIPALINLQKAGYELVMITNQDGLGTDSFPQLSFDYPHNFMMQIFISQGIKFSDVLICPHTEADNCECRKPRTKMVRAWLKEGVLDIKNSYVIGDRFSDMQLGENMGIQSLRYGIKGRDWDAIQDHLTKQDRYILVQRSTKETQIKIEVWLDREGDSKIYTGIGFFDHMLHQIAVHGGLRININVKGDLYIDDHHTVEDTGLALGEALLKALGNKQGIGRFGFMLPMDECLATCALDISGRPYLSYKVKFKYQRIGDLSTEMVKHFFLSLSYSMMSCIHLKATGRDCNDHHCVESLFKAFGRALRQAIHIEGNVLPSSKGIL